MHVCVCIQIRTHTHTPITSSYVSTYVCTFRNLRCLRSLCLSPNRKKNTNEMHWFHVFSFLICPFVFFSFHHHQHEHQLFFSLAAMDIAQINNHQMIRDRTIMPCCRWLLFSIGFYSFACDVCVSACKWLLLLLRRFWFYKFTWGNDALWLFHLY